tara:strand:- start:814 stop:1344 length:531 start_codon:yes stop_codon:yes gene_type:complete
MIRLITLLFLATISTSVLSKGLNVFGIGIYDVKFDGSSKKEATDFRYENRLDQVLFDIGPEEDNFFFLKPFLAFEYTSDSATYLLSGIYLEDNLGQLFEGKQSNYYFTPSFGAGIYDDGSGKKLGNSIQFRTSLELSYEFKNSNRIGLSLSHISNANLGDKNPGVEIISITYQIPY